MFDFRQANQFLGFANRGISTFRRGTDNLFSTFEVDPYRRQAWGSGFQARNQGNLFRAEEFGYRRGVLDQRGQQFGIQPRYQQNFMQPGWGAAAGGVVGAGVIIGQDGSAWQVQQPGWIGRQFGAEPQLTPVAPPGTFPVQGQARGFAPQPQFAQPQFGQPQFAPPPQGLPPVAGPATGQPMRLAPIPPQPLSRDQQVALEAFSRISPDQQRAVAQQMEASGLLPQGASQQQRIPLNQLGSALSTMLNRNGYSTQPGGLLEQVGPRAAFEGSVNAEAQRQGQGQGRSSQPGTPAQGGAGRAAPAAGAATAPLPALERSEDVRRFQHLTTRLDGVLDSNTVETLRRGLQGNGIDGIAGRNTQQVRGEVARQLNMSPNASYRDLNQRLESLARDRGVDVSANTPARPGLEQPALPSGPGLNAVIGSAASTAIGGNELASSARREGQGADAAVPSRTEIETAQQRSTDASQRPSANPAALASAEREAIRAGLENGRMSLSEATTGANAPLPVALNAQLASLELSNNIVMDGSVTLSELQERGAGSYAQMPQTRELGTGIG
jgi:hypothetical protein